MADGYYEKILWRQINNRDGILIFQQHEYLLHPLAVLISYTFMEYRAHCDRFSYHYYSITLFTYHQTDGPILELSSKGKNNLFLKASVFKKGATNC